MLCGLNSSYHQQSLLAMSMFKSAARGFTLIELMVTLALVAILATLAVPEFRSLFANQQLSSVSSDMMASALTARGEALKLNQRVVVAPVSGTDWTQGWRIFVDLDLDGAYTESADKLVSSKDAVPASVTVETFTGSTSNLQKFAFDGTGFLTRTTGFGVGTVVFKSGLTARKKYFVVNVSGRPRICDPSSSPGCEPS